MCSSERQYASDANDGTPDHSIVIAVTAQPILALFAGHDNAKHHCRDWPMQFQECFCCLSRSFDQELFLRYHTSLILSLHSSGQRHTGANSWSLPAIPYPAPFNVMNF
ncbi:hypothetical protein E4U54_008030 [Claviceps lovelessii]|nr:hypothetical protein E4U54_008030 [Claviceps lovelessii]